MKIKASRYNIAVDLKNNKRALYNSFSRGLGVLEGDELEKYHTMLCLGEADPTSEFGRALFSQGFIVPEHVNEIELIKQQYDQNRFQSDTVTLTICPTLMCNFACDYCFQGMNKPKETMSQEIQDAVMALADKVTSGRDNIKQLHVSWYGGEPLIRYDIIESLSDRLIALCQQKGLTYVASMVTHGYFLKPKIAKGLYERGLFQAQITLDGPPEIHDSRRHLLSKKGTFERITSNIKAWIDDYPIQIQVRVNIDERNKDELYRLIDHLEEIGLANKPNFKMYFAPVESMTPGCHSVSEVTMRKLDYGLLETKLNYYAFSKGLADLPYPPVFLGICSAVKPLSFILVPNGDIHKCWDTVSFPDKRVGNIYDNIDDLIGNKTPALQKWAKFSPFKNTTCSNCKILPNCAGHCPYKFVHLGDGIGESALPCPSMKYSINENIVKRCEVAGFITAEDYDLEQIRTNPKDICAEVFNPAEISYA